MGPDLADSRAGRVRLSRLLPLVLFLVPAAVFVLSASAGPGLDVRAADFGAQHLATTGSLWVDDVDIPGIDGRPDAYTWVRTYPNGHRAIARAPGVVLVATPAYLIWGHRGFSDLPGGFTAALVTAASVLLLFLALRREMGQRPAALASLAFAFATPVWTVAADGMYTHTLTVLGITGLAWSSASRRWWVAGLFGAVMIWGRLHSAVIVAVLGLLLGLRERDLRITVRMGVMSAGSLLPMSLWSHQAYGSWSPTAAYGGTSEATSLAHSSLTLANQLGIWVAPDRGILIWTPCILVLLPALVRTWHRLPAWSTALLLGGLAYTLLQTSLITFTGGDGFYGYRLGLELLACATPALALSAGSMGRVARGLLPVTLGVQLSAMALGAFNSGLGRPEDFAWTHNSYLFALSYTGSGAYLLTGALVVISVLVARVLTSNHHGVPTHDVQPAPPTTSGTARTAPTPSRPRS